VLERHPFVICVGREDEPYRIRRATFVYEMWGRAAQGAALDRGRSIAARGRMSSKRPRQVSFFGRRRGPAGPVAYPVLGTQSHRSSGNGDHSRT
jgi:hypothetical protein